MKEMIKEGLSPITDILIGKDNKKINAEAQTIDAIREEEIKRIEKRIQPIKKQEKIVQTINRIEEVMQSEELDTSCVYSLIETVDKRIASVGDDGNISISSFDLNEKKWKRDIHKEKAHKSSVISLCTLIGTRLVSGSSDYSIKVWNLSDIELTLIKEIKEHTKALY